MGDYLQAAWDLRYLIAFIALVVGIATWACPPPPRD